MKDEPGNRVRDGRSVEVGVRRVPELDASPLPESDPELVAQLRAEIERTGPMTFARFMELALYDPDRGYYARRDAPDRGPGRRGDGRGGRGCR